MAGRDFEQGDGLASAEGARGRHRSGDDPALAPPETRSEGEAGEILHSVRSDLGPLPIVVGIFSEEEAITRLIGPIFVEKNDESAVHWARHITLESIADVRDNVTIKRFTAAA